MNKTKLLSLIQHFIEEQNHLASDFEILELTSNLQKATANSLVFYKLHADQKSLENFHKRLESVTPGLLILNRHPGKITKPYLIIDECCFLKAQKILLDEFYPLPPHLKLVGITGTNGKTTTVNLAQQISEQMGHPAISFGTLGICKNGSIVEDLGGTTPSYIELRRLIHQYGKTEEVVYFEVSSHALIQDRLHDLKLDATAWTSFSQDHLDYHKTMDEYFEAKTLISSKYSKPQAPFFVPREEKELIQKFEQLKFLFKRTRSLKDFGFHNVPPFFKADFNRNNFELALELNEAIWKTTPKIDLNKLILPQGRFATLELGEKLVIIDYAHTPDALENICKAVKRSFPACELSLVFGCGGNRDKTKRPIMGAIGERYADKLYITSDNPRDEIPSDIIDDIISGLKSPSNSFHHEDRALTIEKAISESSATGIIIIAGKGHEDYQEIAGIKHPYSDFSVVENFIKNRKS